MKLFTRILLFSIVFTLGLHALSLKANYYIPTKNIYLHTLLPDTKHDTLLYTITEGRYTKRVKTKQLIAKLKKLGYKVTHFSSNYITFTHEIAFNRFKLKHFLQKVYKQRYKDIEIKNIIIHSRGHLKEMPKHYIPKIQSNALLKNKAILSIKANKREYYFDYTIDAIVKVYKAKKRIKRAQTLSSLNLYIKRIQLKHFFAPPISLETKTHYETKHTIQKDAIITQRDVMMQRAVRRGEMIKVTLKENNLSISFHAKALHDGVIGDIIRVKQSNNHILQVKIIGNNQAEVL